MLNVKTKSFHHSLVGKQIPCTKHEVNTGYVGRKIEDIIESFGIKINRYEGVDLIEYGVEVKSRVSYADTYIAIATMNRDYIINTPYKDSIACKKLQQVRIVDYDFNEIKQLATITFDKVYDWSDPVLQNIFENAYERGRRSLKVGLKPSGWWELKTGTKHSFIFKIYASQWDKFKGRFDEKNNYFDLFSK
jgi:hypothetical protein